MPPLFSVRHGFSRIRDLLQIEELDQKTRVGLWNALFRALWKPYESVSAYRKAGGALLPKYWDEIFGKPLSSFPHESIVVSRVRDCFLETGAPWHELLDIIELTMLNLPGEIAKDVATNVNEVFEREHAGYRLIGHLVTPVADAAEAAAIDEAIQGTGAYGGAQEHLRRALTLLADRSSPDYRNAIKEAISAVESACKVIANNPSATLGEGIDYVERKYILHPAFAKALRVFYGYTSDADGIRHGMFAPSTASFVDAKFMLVVCSAFLNYLLAKVAADSGGA